MAQITGFCILLANTIIIEYVIIQYYNNLSHNRTDSIIIVLVSL